MTQMQNRINKLESVVQYLEQQQEPLLTQNSQLKDTLIQTNELIRERTQDFASLVRDYSLSGESRILIKKIGDFEAIYHLLKEDNRETILLIEKLTLEKNQLYIQIDNLHKDVAAEKQARKDEVESLHTMYKGKLDKKKQKSQANKELIKQQNIRFQEEQSKYEMELLIKEKKCERLDTDLSSTKTRMANLVQSSTTRIQDLEHSMNALKDISNKKISELKVQYETKLQNLKIDYNETIKRMSEEHNRKNLDFKQQIADLEFQLLTIKKEHEEFQKETEEKNIYFEEKIQTQGKELEKQEQLNYEQKCQIDHYKNRVQQLQQERAQLKTDLVESKETINNYEAQVKELKATIQQLEDKIKQLEKEHKEEIEILKYKQDREISQIRSDNERYLQQQSVKYEKEVLNLKKDNEIQKEKSEKQVLEFEQIIEKQDEKQREIELKHEQKQKKKEEEHKEAVDEIQRKHYNELGTQKAQIEILNIEIDNLKQYILDQQKRKDTLQNDLNLLQEQIKEKESQNDELIKEISELNEQINVHKDSIHSLEADNNNVKKQYLNGISKKDEEIDELNRQIQNHKGDSDAREGSYKQQIENLQEKIEEQRQEIKDLNSKIDSLDGEIQRKNQEIKDGQKQIQDLNKQIQDLNKQIADLNNTIGLRDSKIMELKNTTSYLKEQNQSQEKQLQQRKESESDASSRFKKVVPLIKKSRQSGLSGQSKQSHTSFQSQKVQKQQNYLESAPPQNVTQTQASTEQVIPQDVVQKTQVQVLQNEQQIQTASKQTQYQVDEDSIQTQQQYNQNIDDNSENIALRQEIDQLKIKIQQLRDQQTAELQRIQSQVTVVEKVIAPEAVDNMNEQELRDQINQLIEQNKDIEEQYQAKINSQKASHEIQQQQLKEAEEKTKEMYQQHISELEKEIEFLKKQIAEINELKSQNPSQKLQKIKQQQDELKNAEITLDQYRNQINQMGQNYSYLKLEMENYKQMYDIFGPNKKVNDDDNRSVYSNTASNVYKYQRDSDMHKRIQNSLKKNQTGSQQSFRPGMVSLQNNKLDDIVLVKQRMETYNDEHIEPQQNMLDHIDLLNKSNSNRTGHKNNFMQNKNNKIRGGQNQQIFYHQPITRDACHFPINGNVGVSSKFSPSPVQKSNLEVIYPEEVEDYENEIVDSISKVPVGAKGQKQRKRFQTHQLVPTETRLPRIQQNKQYQN